MAVIPSARSLFLCDHHFSAVKDKDDLYGICNAIRVEAFPYRLPRLCVFAVLTNGLGKTDFHFDVREADTNKLIHATRTGHLYFPDRRSNIKLAASISNCHFRQEGLYLFELYCNNEWVADSTLDVLQHEEAGDEEE